MKNSTKITFKVLLFLFSCLFIFDSCSKKEDLPEKITTPLIENVFRYDKNGQVVSEESYIYDNQLRLIKAVYGDEEYETLEYLESSIIGKVFYKGSLDYSAEAKLNSQGLCTSISAESEYFATTIEYDSNGYRKSIRSESESRVNLEISTVSNGNYVSISSSNNPKLTKSISEYDEITEYQFYPDKANTIEHQNFGIFFRGKQNKNPIKKEIKSYYLGGELVNDITTFTYEFDTNGRIIKQTDDKGNYSVYTYINK